MGFDFLAPCETLKIGQHTKKKTTFGGFLSLVSIILIFLASYSIGDEIFLKQNPNLLVQNLNSINSPTIKLTEENFSFGFILMDYYGNILIDYQKYFKVEILYSSFIFKDGEFIIDFMKTLKFVNCTGRKITGGEQYEKLFSRINYVDQTNMELAGNLDSNYIKYITLTIHKCDNKTMNNTCASASEISNQLNKMIYVNILHTDRTYNAKNFKNPFVEYLKSTSFLLSDNIHKSITAKYQETKIITDIGFFLSDFRESLSFNFEGYQQDNSNLRADDMLLYFDIYSSQNHAVINRSYLKVQTFLAQIGGIINFFIYILRIILFLYKKNERDIELINNYIELEDFKTSKPKEKLKLYENRMLKKKNYNNTNKSNNENKSIIEQKINYKIKVKSKNNKNNEKNVISVNNFLIDNENIQNIDLINKKQIITNKSNIKKTYDLYRQSIRDLSRTFEFGFFQKLLPSNFYNYFSSKKSKVKDKNYKKFSSILYHFTDLNKIFRLIQDFENFKYLFLTKEQFTFFNFISSRKKIKISENNKQILPTSNRYFLIIIFRKNSVDFINSEEEHFELVEKYFQDICNSETENSQVDDRLIDLLDPKLLELFLENNYK